MKEIILKWFLDHTAYIFSTLCYCVLEYKIGKNKNINGNSLLEVIENKFFKGK